MAARMTANVKEHNDSAAQSCRKLKSLVCTGQLGLDPLRQAFRESQSWAKRESSYGVPV
jgi:hypothetical protein